MLQYFLFGITILYLLVYGYIKIKYPFWNNQPVFHTYDYWRRFYREPFVIYKYRPIKTKFCNFLDIKTHPYLDISTEEKRDVLYLLKSNYISSDRIMLTLEEKELDALYSGHIEKCFISYYYSTVFRMDLDSDPEPDPKKEKIICDKEITGCLMSNPVNIYYKNTDTDKIYTETSLYYMDYLCINKDIEFDKYKKIVQKNDTKKIRELFQTHEYNQRIENSQIVGSLIKREIELFEGIVPLVQYITYVYYLRNLVFPPLPKHYYVIQITSENIDLLIDFLYIKTHLDLEKTPDHLAFLSVTSLGNYIEMIKQNMYYVFCLKSGEYIYGMYFFKDAKMQYEDIEGNTLQFYGSFMNTDSFSLFYLGFLHSIHQIVKKFPEFKMLIFENLGDNMKIHGKWRERNTPVFENKTAYYTFNWIYPSSPIFAGNCLVL
uniref:Glycylpeptide N-tetradecanoyltransferase n=1 Tax=viral metagenome TaxID=1070528 RepID=A0A6C0HTC3_9ZZZZ